MQPVSRRPAMVLYRQPDEEGLDGGGRLGVARALRGQRADPDAVLEQLLQVLRTVTTRLPRRHGYILNVRDALEGSTGHALHPTMRPALVQK